MRVRATSPSTAGMLCVLLLGGASCLADWDAYQVGTGAAAGGGGAGSQASSGMGTGTGAGTGTGTGAGGSAGCAPPLLPAMAPCGGLTDTFDSQARYDAQWSAVTDPQDIEIAGGVARLHLAAAAPTAYNETKQGFALQGCAVWVEIVEAATGSGLTTRLSLGAAGQTSYYSVGVLEGELEARAASTPVASIAYDPVAMRHVRVRAEGGAVHFDHSADAVCWAEFHAEPDPPQFAMRARLVLSHVPAGPGVAAEAAFDKFGIVP